MSIQNKTIITGEEYSITNRVIWIPMPESQQQNKNLPTYANISAGLPCFVGELVNRKKKQNIGRARLIKFSTGKGGGEAEGEKIL